MLAERTALCHARGSLNVRKAEPGWWATRQVRRAAPWALAAALVAPAAQAAYPAFGVNDVATVFFIAKSDDHNRVDYWIKLDASCNPVGDEAVTPYWREFEKAPPVVTHSINWLDRMAYGVAAQHATRRTPAGGDYFMRLKQVGRPIGIATKRGSNGKCVATARTTIAGVTAELDSIFAKLSGPISVSYIDIKGKDMRTGKPIVERLMR
jgi:hypothetical protein